jgi:hypothetical protein
MITLFRLQNAYKPSCDVIEDFPHREKIYRIVETLGKRNGQVQVREQPRRHFVQLRVIRNGCKSNELRIRTFVIYRETFHKGG